MALAVLVFKKLIITQKIAQKSSTSNQNETRNVENMDTHK